jgi:hypothetical protein
VAYYSRGAAYAKKGDDDRAMADLNKALELSNDPNLRQAIAEALESLGADN